MMSEEQRAKLNKLDPIPVTFNYSGLIYPAHLEFLKKKASIMNRSVHQLINEARMPNAFPKPKTVKTELPVFKPGAIESAKVGDLAGIGPDSTIEAGISFTDCVEMFKTPHYQASRVNECLYDESETTVDLLSQCEGGLVALHTALRSYYDLPELADDVRGLLRTYNRFLTKTVNRYIKATVNLSWSIDSFVEDFPELLNALQQEGLTKIEEYLEELVIGGLDDILSREGACLPVAHYGVIYLPKTAEAMGLYEVTDEVPVQLSKVYHPSLLSLLESIFTQLNCVQVVCFLQDDEYLFIRSPLDLSCWSVQRVA